MKPNKVTIILSRITPALLKHPICLRKPERVIEFDGHVIGLSLSPDGAELFVNVRSWPTDAVPTMDQTPSIASQIEMHVIDMATLERKSGKVGRQYDLNVCRSLKPIVRIM